MVQTFYPGQPCVKNLAPFPSPLTNPVACAFGNDIYVCYNSFGLFWYRFYETPFRLESFWTIFYTRITDKIYLTVICTILSFMTVKANIYNFTFYYFQVLSINWGDAVPQRNRDVKINKKKKIPGSLPSL
jgi:hypothetical protein